MVTVVSETQALLFDTNEYDVDPNFVQDDYETPDGTGGSLRLAQAFAGLVSGIDGEDILDCSAGSGRVAQFLPPGTTCIELRCDRVERGKQRAPQCQWIEGNCLKLTLADLGRTQPFKRILSNLPFSIAVEFIEHCRHLLHPDGEMLFLLPMSYFSTNEHADALAELEAQGLRRIHIHQIRGRVAYLKGNVPLRGRQCDDAIHVFCWNVAASAHVTTLDAK